MDNTLKHVQIHRLGEHVAAYLNGKVSTGTVYLTPEEAEEIGSQLQRYARDVRATDFTDSKVGTYSRDGEA